MNRAQFSALSWGGLATIAVSAFLFSGSTPFPGITALVPCLGTLAVLAAGDATGWFGTSWFTSLRPIQYVGDISYSLYLWHWPLIVVFPFVFGVGIGLRASAAIVAVSLILAALTKRFVEDPLRNPAAWVGRNWQSFSMAAVSGLLVISVAGGGLFFEQKRLEVVAAQTKSLAVEKAQCFGAAAVANHCATIDEPVLDPNFGIGDHNPSEHGNCTGGAPYGPHRAEGDECLYGDPAARKTVVLVGDSHSRHWMGAIDAIARARGWRLIFLFLGSCPFGDVPYTSPPSTPANLCLDWRRDVLDYIVGLKPAMVFTSALTADGYKVAGFSLATTEQQITGYSSYLERLTAAGIPITVIHDVPYLPEPPYECLAKHTVPQCSYPRGAVLDSHFDALAAAGKQTPGVLVIDLGGYFCPNGLCGAAIGGVIVYIDGQHLTNTFALSLVPYIERALDAHVRSGA